MDPPFDMFIILNETLIDLHHFVLRVIVNSEEALMSSTSLSTWHTLWHHPFTVTSVIVSGMFSSLHEVREHK